MILLNGAEGHPVVRRDDLREPQDVPHPIEVSLVTSSPTDSSATAR
jgi:hypothetical protein